MPNKKVIDKSETSLTNSGNSLKQLPHTSNYSYDEKDSSSDDDSSSSSDDSFWGYDGDYVEPDDDLSDVIEAPEDEGRIILISNEIINY